MSSLPGSAAPSRLRLALAFGVIYLVWGSTFLGIRVAVETLPPLAMSGVRFLAAGALLLLFARLFTPGPHYLPTRREALGAAATGALFFLGNHALVASVAHLLPSSVVCLIIATEVPIIAVLSSLLLPGQPLTRRSLLGAALGIGGVVTLLLLEGGFGGRGAAPASLPLLPVVMVLGASISWSLGAVVSQRLGLAPGRLALPRAPLVRAGLQMFSGGALLALASGLRGEWPAVRAAAFSARSLGAFAYLVLFGSLLAFACYTFLLRHARTEAVATHVFVNPLVAVVVGAALGGEPLKAVWLLPGALILASVAVITLGRGKAPAPQPAEEERCGSTVALAEG